MKFKEWLIEQSVDTVLYHASKQPNLDKKGIIPSTMGADAHVSYRNQPWVYLGSKDYVYEEYLKYAKEGTYYVYAVDASSLDVDHNLPGNQVRVSGKIDPNRVKLVDEVSNSPDKHPQENDYLSWYKNLQSEQLGAGGIAPAQAAPGAMQQAALTPQMPQKLNAANEWMPSALQAQYAMPKNIGAQVQLFTTQMNNYLRHIKAQPLQNLMIGNVRALNNRQLELTKKNPENEVRNFPAFDVNALMSIGDWLADKEQEQVPGQPNQQGQQ
jgi:hypothetical protein